MAPTHHDDAPKTAGEVREQFLEHLRNFPDFDALVEAGTLRSIGGGWYESDRGLLPDGVGKYMNVRIRGGKAQYKPLKLTKELKALKDSL
jgi:hypothetical protein